MDRQIKILVVLSGLSAGGAETMYMNLYRKLDKTKYKIDFLVFPSNNGFYADEVKRNGSKVLEMSSIKRSGISGFSKSIEKAIVENGPYDVIHSHIDYLSGIVMRVAKKCNVKIRLAHSHNTSSYTHRGSIPAPLMWYVRKLITQNATKCLACSHQAANFMFGESKAKDAIVVNNAIDLKRFTDVGQYDGTLNDLRNSNKKIILHIGRFVEQKNHEGLIRIFSEYIKKNSNTLLLLVGEGNLKEDIIKLVEDCGLQDHVQFLGARADIPELLSVADTFILPSNFEGLPVTLIEAQAMNVPCVVSENIKRDVDCGIDLISFIPLDDHNAWTDAIENAIGGRTRNNNYSIMTNKGYNIDNNVDIIEQLYSGNV